MKMFVLFVPLLLVLEALGQTRPPEFSGYFSIGKQHLFVLTNLETQESSGWIGVGSAFHGFTIEDFDVEKGVLVLRSGAGTSKVPLKASRVIESKSKPRRRTTSSEVEGGSELRMTMTRDGVLSLNGHAFPGETLDALFTVMAKEREGLLLIIERQYPRDEQSVRDMELLKKLMARMRDAGLKRLAISMTNAPEDALAK